MNIEDSKSTLINAIGDLPFSNGEVLAITPPRTQDLVDKCPSSKSPSPSEPAPHNSLPKIA